MRSSHQNYDSGDPRHISAGVQVKPVRIIRLVTTGKAAFAFNVLATLMAGFLVTTLQHVLEARPVPSGMGGAFLKKLLSKAMNHKDAGEQRD